MGEERIAVVTGANRGIGREIARQLGLLGFHVIVTARDEEKAMLTQEEFEREGITASYHELDVTDHESIDCFTRWLGDSFGKVDVLVNNAAIFVDGSKDTKNLDMKTMVETMDTNLYGPLRVSQALIPLLMKGSDARIVNLSSGLGALEGGRSGYPAYSISKTALNALTVKMAADLKRDGIRVNCMCPGWVRTDMGGPNASRSVEEGADTTVWLATASGVPSGKFFRDREEIEW